MVYNVVMKQPQADRKRTVLQVGIIIVFVIGAFVVHNLLTEPTVPVPQAESR